MNLTIEKIIEIVTREVISELSRRGYLVDTGIDNGSGEHLVMKSMEPDMSKYKTPVLTENHFQNMETDIRELILDERTVITPGARDIIKKRGIRINYKS